MCLLDIREGIQAMNLDLECAGCEKAEELVGIALELFTGGNVAKKSWSGNPDTLWCKAAAT